MTMSRINASIDVHGYLVARGHKGHELATADGRVYVHRVVMFNAIGYGPHQCEHCGKHVNWKAPNHTDELVVDHRNGKRHDNRLANLIVSCHACNIKRKFRCHGSGCHERIEDVRRRYCSRACQQRAYRERHAA